MKWAQFWLVTGASVMVVAVVVWTSRQGVAPGRDDAGPESGASGPAAPVPASVPAAPVVLDPSRSPVLPERAEEERQSMTKIRALLHQDPRQALALIDAADRTHREGRLAEERAALRVDAMVYADQIGLARDAAEDFLRRYPEGAYAEHIEVLTGVHPRPVP
jgi:hypothetical protein